jgi:hypothetical protein
VNFRLILCFKSIASNYTKKEEGFQKWNKLDIKKGFEQANINAILAVALLFKLRSNLSCDLIY